MTKLPFRRPKRPQTARHMTVGPFWIEHRRTRLLILSSHIYGFATLGLECLKWYSSSMATASGGCLLRWRRVLLGGVILRPVMWPTMLREGLELVKILPSPWLLSCLQWDDSYTFFFLSRMTDILDVGVLFSPHLWNLMLCTNKNKNWEQSIQEPHRAPNPWM